MHSYGRGGGGVYVCGGGGQFFFFFLFTEHTQVSPGLPMLQSYSDNIYPFIYFNQFLSSFTILTSVCLI